jgi:hypothetical protein
MFRIILVLAVCAFGNPDSLRVIQLEARIHQIEMEKVQKEREAEKAKIAELEAAVRGMAARQATIDSDALWTAGDKIQSSIWLDLAASGCMFLAQVGAVNGDPGIAFIGLAGGVTFGIMSIVKRYGAGTSLKRAANR